MFNSLSNSVPRPLLFLKRAGQVVVVTYLVIGAFATWRSYYQVHSLDLQVDNAVLHPGSTITANLISYGSKSHRRAFRSNSGQPHSDSRIATGARKRVGVIGSAHPDRCAGSRSLKRCSGPVRTACRRGENNCHWTTTVGAYAAASRA
jgi:hypothetical protein